MRWISLISLMIAVACTGTEGARPAAPVAVSSRVDSSRVVKVVTSSSIDSSGTDTAAVRFDAAGHPISPVVLRDYCEGEDCETHFAAIACLPAGLRDAPNDSAKISVPLSEGDSAEVVRRDLRITSPGVVVVR